MLQNVQRLANQFGSVGRSREIRTIGCAKAMIDVLIIEQVPRYELMMVR